MEPIHIWRDLPTFKVLLVVHGTRFTKDGYRLRANTNCENCRKRLAKELRELRKKLILHHPQPEFGLPCDLCKNPVNRNWQLDHCHKTGKFRGWICKSCNTGLGSLGDSFESALKAVVYLAKFKAFESDYLIKIILKEMKKNVDFDASIS